jgi:hypothetical protein
MGGIKIIVQPGVRVFSDGFGVMGGFEQMGEPSAAELAPDAPTVRVVGIALMGGVEISERLPGETHRDAKRRRRQGAPTRGGRLPPPPDGGRN